MDKDAMLKAASAVAAKKANGQVLRTINILRDKFNSLDVVQSILDGSGVRIDEFRDALNYLMLAGYIQIRKVDNQMPADLADVSYKECEARLSAKGIQLLGGVIKDEMVEV